MDPMIARKLLEGHQDILTDQAEHHERFYSSQSCPRCGGGCRRVGDLRTMFKGDKALPCYQLECLACGCLFDPHNGLILELGNIGQAIEPAIPILKTD
jgi:hypothetical protein